jgi:hypothetical protein
MARQLKVSPKAFEAAVDSFIDYCKTTHTIPSDYMLLEHLETMGLKISVGTLDRYYMAMSGTESTSNGDDSVRDLTVYREHGKALKKLIAYREHMTMQQSIDNPKTAGHTAFRLKQARWGSWSDKQESSQDVAITVKLDFAGDKSKPQKGRK